MAKRAQSDPVRVAADIEARLAASLGAAGRLLDNLAGRAMPAEEQVRVAGIAERLIDDVLRKS